MMASRASRSGDATGDMVLGACRCCVPAEWCSLECVLGARQALEGALEGVPAACAHGVASGGTTFWRRPNKQFTEVHVRLLRMEATVRVAVCELLAIGSKFLLRAGGMFFGACRSCAPVECSLERVLVARAGAWLHPPYNILSQTTVGP